MKLIPNLAEIDRKAIQQYGIPALDLMERAGDRVAAQVMRRTHREDRLVILCGPGNNGGDGFVCARLLHRAGYGHLSVVYTGNNYHGEALTNLEALMGLPVEIIDAKAQMERALQQIGHADAVVDALFGSGLARPVAGLEADLIAAVNANGSAWVLAVDIPSGVDGATGQVLGHAVQADETVTLASAKPGLYLHPGKAMAGAVHVADIGIPVDLIEVDESPIRLIQGEQAARWLPRRHPAGHKYDFGNVLVVAGSVSMPGAAVLTAGAALSAGAGLVTLAAPKGLFESIAVPPELIRLPLPQDASGALHSDSLPPLREAIRQKRYDVIALGPGLGQAPETVRLVWELLSGLPAGQPVVIDADGLNALSFLQDENFQPGWERPQIGLEHPAWVLTPHVGEASRLLRQDKSVLNADLLKASRCVQEVWAANVVLKSASTVVATVDGLLWVTPTGNSGLATAGSGDVLSGVIAGLAGQLAAQKLPVMPAAPLGVYLHGLAGDAAAQALTPYCMQAGDIARHLPAAFHSVMKEVP